MPDIFKNQKINMQQRKTYLKKRSPFVKENIRANCREPGEALERRQGGKSRLDYYSW